MTAFSRAPVVALAIIIAASAAACGEDEPAGSGPTASTSVATSTTATTDAAGADAGGGSDTTSPSAVAIDIAVRGGSVEGPSRQRVSLNQSVLLRVTSDVADEVHVHGFEERAGVGPGRVAEITFVAYIPGTFEVELEQSHRRLTTLEVRP